MFHASHHITPVVATDREVRNEIAVIFSIGMSLYHGIDFFFLILEIEAEASAIKVVAESLCPLDIVLDRLVLTSTGVLLGCWQVCALLLWEFYRTSCIANLV